MAVAGGRCNQYSEMKSVGYGVALMVASMVVMVCVQWVVNTSAARERRGDLLRMGSARLAVHFA